MLASQECFCINQQQTSWVMKIAKIREMQINFKILKNGAYEIVFLQNK